MAQDLGGSTSWVSSYYIIQLYFLFCLQRVRVATFFMVPLASWEVTDPLNSSLQVASKPSFRLMSFFSISPLMPFLRVLGFSPLIWDLVIHSFFSSHISFDAGRFFGRASSSNVSHSPDVLESFREQIPHKLPGLQVTVLICLELRGSPYQMLSTTLVFD